jgi:hypothetical protein
MKNIPLLFFMFLLLFACNGVKKNTGEKEIQSLRKFYFPIEELMGDGLVYEYLDDSLKVVADYTLYKTVKDEAGDLFLVAARYNGLFEQTYVSSVWIAAEGTILKDYQFIETDSISGKSIVTPAKIEENIYFPFKSSPDSGKIYRYTMSVTLPSDSALNIDIVRERKFDKFLEYEFDGQKRAAVQFIGTDYQSVFDAKNKGADLKTSSEIKEIYAAGIGLVFIEQKVGATYYRNRLNRRISPDEFLKIQIQNK